MPLILHLSDLHLVGSSKSPPVGEHKASLVPSPQRDTHHELMRRTLKGLAQRLIGEGRRLDAVVMTGDIANQNDAGGYTAFLELLEALGDLRPEPSHVVVSPGNHDVARGLRPGDPARYEPFVTIIRGAGFVTPLLSGIDNSVPTGEADRAHILRVSGLEIVPIDTSAYAQVEIDVGLNDAAWDAALNVVDKIAGDKGVKALRKLRIVDAARIAEEQLEAVHRMLTETRPAFSPGRHASQNVIANPFRIAVLHHHLLPVSVKEEVKGFESITNLGLVRQFLRENNFAMVLHGHKHAPHSYIDYVVSYDHQGAQVPRQIRVIAGPSPSGRTLDDEDMCRLIDIDLASGGVSLESVPAVQAGHPAKAGTSQKFVCMPPGTATWVRTDGIAVIDGKTIADVYAGLVPNLVDAVGDGELENVICRMEESPTDEAIAALYPGFINAPDEARSHYDGDEQFGVSTQLAEFQQLVRWWQRVELIGGVDEPPFTHGNRILRYDGHLDQLANVVDALRRKPRTSRAVIVLLHPGADRISTMSRQFPSFCLVQFLVTERESGNPPRLECVAYFRKQEMRYWWLVNVAELALLQRKVVAELARTAKGDIAWLSRATTGPVTTVAARAHVDRVPPKVQIPKVDQYYAASRERLVDMAHAVVWAQMPSREEAGHDWLRLMLDVVPAVEWDSDGVPVARVGLRYLAEQVRRHASQGAPSGVAELADSLETLWRENEGFAKDQQLERVNASRHAEWRAAVMKHVQRIVELTYAPIVGGPLGEKVAGSKKASQKNVNTPSARSPAGLRRSEDGLTSRKARPSIVAPVGIGTKPRAKTAPKKKTTGSRKKVKGKAKSPIARKPKRTRQE